MDWMVTVSGSLLILAIVIYTGYMTYTHRTVLANIKTDLVTQIMNGRPGTRAGVADMEQEFLNPANKNLIPCPPPAPPASSGNLSDKDTKTASMAISVTENGGKTVSATNPAASGGSGSVLSTPIWLQEIKSNEIFNKRKKVSGYDEDVEEEDGEDIDDGDEYPDVKILHKTIDKNLLSKKEYVY